ncbi:septation initiation network scaffold protein cdc11 [Rhypophila decipiens]|uniref:Septation initiation network scaffold protein cdc11 n=1 Tax=Rhypophila decipiens TaxID=261697 RepID=A0AAN6Y0B2_9PEZI|nr:septation initiation network scaffold protein cdc11 [Rhypophila decipiens]
MAPAWLDSLSEDWVSEPGSKETSFTAPSAPTPPSAAQTPPSSRIPRLCHSHKKRSVDIAKGNSSVALSERSVNKIIATASRTPPPSKLSQEIRVRSQSQSQSQSQSRPGTHNRAVSSGSVVHNTVNHKSLGESPSRRAETPEWKRRLVYGDLSYGEQPDLFTSAATGLENIFKPPPAAPDPPARGHETRDQETESQYELTLPSSPPQYHQEASAVDIRVDDSAQEYSEMAQKRAPTHMRYRLNEDSAEASRIADQSLQEGDSYSQWPSVDLDQNGLSLPQDEVSDAQSRKVSGQSVVRNEDFSPILLERHQASNGDVAYGPTDLPPDELRKRLENVRKDQLVLETDASHGAQDSELEANNSDTTANYRALGGFVNLRRGGQSADGSFRQHMLSSALNDTSELNPEESLQASTPKQFPTVKVQQWDSAENMSTESPDYPRPPGPSPEKKVPQLQNASGSPLKLFQPYDTFTNQTLLRRLSQFEEKAAEETPSRAQESEDFSINPDPSCMLSPPRSPTRRARDRRRLSQFGAGELDGYEFNDEFSYEANGNSMLDADKENCGPDGESVHLPRAPSFGMSRDSLPDESDDLIVRRSRQKPWTPHPSKFANKGVDPAMRAETRLSVPITGELLSTPVRGDISEIKRPRTSPSKDPTPKRRRTLHKSDVGYELFLEQSQALDSVHHSHLQMQSAITAQVDDSQDDDQEDDGEVFTKREMARPRTPTPMQRHGQGSAPPAFRPLIDSESRKPSIRTEDFINEANKIMAMIRNKAGLASGLASLEESSAEDAPQPSPDLESSYESTQEPFSRPPSREGRAPVARMSARQVDPEVVERLKKYEESDMGDVIGESMRSNGISSVAQSSVNDGENWTRVGSNNSWPSSLGHGVISDPPNIRLSRNPDHFDIGDNAVPTHSSGHSTGRSYQTGSSRTSENRRTIAPESVEHLIPDKVGNMVLDRQRNIWIKRKSGSSSGSSKDRNFLPSEASEDDPFADIPDLSVDMTMELNNLMATRAENAAKLAEKSAATAGRGPVLIPAPVSSPARDQDSIPSMQETRPPRQEEDDDTVEDEIGIHEDRVSAATRRRNLTISFSSPIASFIQDVVDERLEGYEEDQSILDQTFDEISRESTKRGRRVISIQATTTTRSGPARHLSVRGQTLMARPISRIDEREEESAFDRARARLQQEQASNMELSIIADNNNNNSSILSEAGGSGMRQASLSFVVATPANRQRDCPAQDVDGAPVISQYVGTYSLSPLSEFTIHRGEGDSSLPLEASYIVGNHHLVTGDGSKRVMSLNTRELVEKLAEVEPFEPYWEDMRDLKLANKRLGSLHGLKEFCSQLESLDVSHNQVRNLTGIPESVRQLKINHNQLSGLTAWNHLIHLQYVDVSNNGLTSLGAFKNLVHLRSLRADNNQITSLDGIKFHDGLLSLRARGNNIAQLDFWSNKLVRLAELDLKDNKIARVTGLQNLPCLSSLNLENNQLESFSIEAPAEDDAPSSAVEPVQKKMETLRYLHLNDNKLSKLDIRLLPHLRLLHADRNRLVRIDGFSRAKKVDSLSLREQSGEKPLDLGHLLSRAYEVRKLYLSGNYFGSPPSSSSPADEEEEDGCEQESRFQPTVDMLNLQLLELANCGLARLPEGLGMMLPNLRVVNLNMNALVDLSPLVGIPRLKRVLVSGNRLADCARLVRVLAAFGMLSCVDVRDNPGTQGFYAPPLAQAIVKATSSGSGRGGGSEKEEAFTLPDQDKERDAVYCKRLDMETRMRRRVYEQMFVGCCKRLGKLDGLAIDGREVAQLRDGVWLALAERGLFVERRDQVVQEKKDGKEGVKADGSARWGAEDSFGGW